MKKHRPLTTKEKWMVVLFSPLILFMAYIFSMVIIIFCPFIYLYHKRDAIANFLNWFVKSNPNCKVKK